MTQYSVAEAKNNLPKLIDLALQGEDVTITRRGKVVIKLTPQTQEARPVDVEWFRANLLTPENGPLDIAADIRTLRDDYRY